MAVTSATHAASLDGHRLMHAACQWAATSNAGRRQGRFPAGNRVYIQLPQVAERLALEETSNRFAIELLLQFLLQMVDGDLECAVDVVARDRAVDEVELGRQIGIEGVAD
jgi:hypothetical protein